MLYFDLTSLTAGVVVVLVLPVLTGAVVTTRGKGVGNGVIALLLLLVRLGGPDSKSVLGFLLTGLPSLETLTISPPCSFCCCC